MCEIYLSLTLSLHLYALPYFATLISGFTHFCPQLIAEAIPKKKLFSVQRMANMMATQRERKYFLQFGFIGIRYILKKEYLKYE